MAASFFYLEVILLSNIQSIIKGMTIKERSDGRYEGRLTNFGTRKSFYGKTKAEVKTKAKEYLLKVENGYRDPKKILLNDYIEYWLKTYKWNKIEPTSYSRLFRVWDKQIKNTIGNKNIGDISTQDIQKLIDAHANPDKSDIKALSSSGLKRIVHLLRPCMNTAVKEGVIYKNPCIDVIMPRESCIQKETRKQFSLTDDEIERFKNTVLTKKRTKNEYISRDGIVLLIILNLGLRVGEALALTWNDVDFDNGIIHINKTMQNNIINFEHQHGDKVTYNRLKKSTKTNSGMRVLYLNEDVSWYFNELKLYDERNNIKSEYICATGVGTLNTSRNLQRSLDRLLRIAGINRRATLHTLRHTFGSTLLRKGVNIEVVSKLMGHSSITITLNKYIHTVQEEEAKAMKNITIC